MEHADRIGLLERGEGLVELALCGVDPVQGIDSTVEVG
jgi:hypothetical protein